MHGNKEALTLLFNIVPRSKPSPFPYRRLYLTIVPPPTLLTKLWWWPLTCFKKDRRESRERSTQFRMLLLKSFGMFLCLFTKVPRGSRSSVRNRFTTSFKTRSSSMIFTNQHSTDPRCSSLTQCTGLIKLQWWDTLSLSRIPLDNHFTEYINT